MTGSQKNVFWQAFIVTIFIFGIGIVFGIILEDYRVGKIDTLYQTQELELLDIKLQTEVYSTNLFDCDQAVRENIRFADKIYNESQILDKYEKASTLKSEISLWHMKYDVLRANVLLNSMRIRQKCNSSYYEVAYIYKYNSKDLNVQARQNVFSKLLYELKMKKGNEVLLIPIAGDNDLSSVNLIMGSYGIDTTDLPVIVINGKKKITNLETIDELMKNFE